MEIIEIVNIWAKRLEKTTGKIFKNCILSAMKYVQSQTLDKQSEFLKNTNVRFDLFIFKQDF